MAGLVIGATSLDVVSFAEGAPVLVGETTRAFSGAARTSVRAGKRTFRAVSGNYGKTTYDALRAACANETPVSVSGDCLVGATLTCLVRLTYDLVGIGTAEDGYNFLYRITLDLQEA